MLYLFILNRLAGKRFISSTQGFTLIELLVVIIIIGILSAIALPSFLAQGSKARQSEAKIYVGTAIKTQITHRNEEGEFTTDWGKLQLDVPKSTANYTYEVIALKGDNNKVDEAVAILANPKTKDLKSYVGGVQVFIRDNSPSIESILCESKKPGLAASKATVDMSGERLKCATEAKEVK